jgi:hypothetical protein
MKIICIKEYKLIYTTYSVGSIYDVDKISSIGFTNNSNILERYFYPKDNFMLLYVWRNRQIDKILSSF